MPNFKTTTIISRLLIFSTLFIFFNSFFSVPVYALCDKNNPNPIECGAGLTQIEETFARFISVSVGIGFVALLILLVMAGIRYLTSGGEPKAISSAHQTITWALLGIFMMAVAWVLLQIIYTLTGVEVRFFDIKSLCGTILGC